MLGTYSRLYLFKPDILYIITGYLEEITIAKNASQKVLQQWSNKDKFCLSTKQGIFP